MKSSIENLKDNDEVLVMENDERAADSPSRGGGGGGGGKNNSKKGRPKSRGEEYRGPKEGAFFTEFCKRFPGIIRRAK
jgi:hypothetical protein